MLSCTFWAMASLSLACALQISPCYIPVQRGYLNPICPRGPVQDSPNGAEDDVVEDRQEHLRALLLPRREVEPAKRQPAGPPPPPRPNSPNRNPRRLLPHPPPLPAPKTHSPPRPDPLSQGAGPGPGA